MRTHLILAKRLRSWTVKKAEHRRSDAFELWCWRRLLRVPWTERRSNPSILKEISPIYIHWKDWCWSWNSNTLATSCEELTHWERPWCWVRLKAGGEGDNRGWDGWVAPPTRWTWVWVSSGSWWWTGKPGMLQSMGSQRVRRLSDWTEPWEQLLQGRDHAFSLSPRIKTMWGRTMQYPRDRSKPLWCGIAISV